MSRATRRPSRYLELAFQVLRGLGADLLGLPRQSARAAVALSEIWGAEGDPLRRHHFLSIARDDSWRAEERPLRLEVTASLARLLSGHGFDRGSGAAWAEVLITATEGEDLRLRLEARAELALGLARAEADALALPLAQAARDEAAAAFGAAHPFTVSLSITRDLVGALAGLPSLPEDETERERRGGAARARDRIRVAEARARGHLAHGETAAARLALRAGQYHLAACRAPSGRDRALLLELLAEASWRQGRPCEALDLWLEALVAEASDPLHDPKELRRRASRRISHARAEGYDGYALILERACFGRAVVHTLPTTR